MTSLSFSIKKFADLLSPTVATIFNETQTSSLPLPPTMLQAQVVMFPKSNKDPYTWKSYRPISLLNIDVKLLTKILAHRLN